MGQNKKRPDSKIFRPRDFSLIEDHDMQSLAERQKNETLLKLLKRPRFNVKTATRLLKRVLEYRKEFWSPEIKTHFGINVTNLWYFFKNY